MAPSRRVSDLDFGIAQRALESLATTFDDFAKHRAYELEDALDAHLTEPVGSGQWFGLIAGLREAIYQQGGTFAPGDRFSSYEEMSQWVKAVAEQRGFQTREKNYAEEGEVTQDDLRWLYVKTPIGELSFSFQGGAVGTGGPIDAGQAGKLTREILRAARVLQDDA
jgi:hypothetical protein